jgi:hypothetical protein
MRVLRIAVLVTALLSTSCGVDLKGVAQRVESKLKTQAKPEAKSAEQGNSGRLVMFIGVDISGSFMHGRYFNDSIDFLAHYIHAHLNGLGGMEVPNVLFVGSIGGVKQDEAKTLYPIEKFQDRSVEQIAAELHEIFPVGRVNTFTDFNAFFGQVGDMIDQKKLLMKPVSIVLLTDGDPDIGDGKGGSAAEKFHRLSVSPLEGLSRNITVRVLYTDAVIAKNWRDEMPRKRVKVWTQDAVVMAEWNDPRLMVPGKPFDQQVKFFSWVKDNVDFTPRLKRVD